MSHGAPLNLPVPMLSKSVCVVPKLLLARADIGKRRNRKTGPHRNAHWPWLSSCRAECFRFSETQPHTHTHTHTHSLARTDVATTNGEVCRGDEWMTLCVLALCFAGLAERVAKRERLRGWDPVQLETRPCSDPGEHTHPLTLSLSLSLSQLSLL